MKKVRILLSTLAVLCMAGGLALAGSKAQDVKAAEAAGLAVPSGAQTVSFAAEDWTYSGSGEQDTFWQINSNSINFKGGSGWTDHMLLTDQFDTAVANYTMEATFTGTISSAVTDEAYCGFVPWYIDSNNWVMVYAQWVSWDRPSEIRAIHFYAKINGSVNVYMMTCEEDQWGWHNTAEWHEQWTNGCGILPADGFKLVVSKTRSVEAGVASDWFGIVAKKKDGTTFKDVANWNLKLRDSGVIFGYDKPKVGFWCQKDVFAITDIAFTHDGYTKNTGDGFLSDNAYNFFDKVSAAGECAAIQANPSSEKAALESAHSALSAKDLASLANVTYNGGKDNVLQAYDYYVAYAASLISTGANFMAIINKDNHAAVIIVAVSFAAISLAVGFLFLRKKFQHK